MHGADIDLSAWSSLPLRALLFGEAQARVVVSTAKPDVVLAVARSHGVPAREIGLRGSQPNDNKATSYAKATSHD